MAGDWLKMRTRLGEERAVLLICELTGLDQFSVVGRLHAFWSWAGEHTVTGRITDVTLKTVDRVTAHNGFGAAMVSANWLVTPVDGGIEIPRWNEHNGKAAKARYLASQRQVKKRKKLSRAASRTPSRSSVTCHATREEKSREDIKGVNPLKPPPEADRLFEIYPRRVGKAAALKAIQRALAKETFENLSEAVAAFAKARNGQDQQFTPHPATWFNQERWKDDRSTWNANRNGTGALKHPLGPGERFDESAGSNDPNFGKW